MGCWWLPPQTPSALSGEVMCLKSAGKRSDKRRETEFCLLGFSDLGPIPQSFLFKACSGQTQGDIRSKNLGVKVSISPEQRSLGRKD